MTALLTPLRVAASVLAISAGLLVPTTSVDAATAYAPVDRAGPALSLPLTTLQAAVKCSGNFHANSLEPVLLNPATGTTPTENFSWNYEKAFTAQSRPWCQVTVPNHALNDIQTAGEYITYAIRYTYALAGRKIAIIGHSQGGMSMRWALRFWPDTRPMVDDVIGLAPDNHGTTVINGICTVGVTTCVPAAWQQRSVANFMTALNSGQETFAGISYTEIYTHTDEVVTPSTGATPSAAVSGPGLISNVATQDVCPLDVFEHLTVGTIDPTAYALAMDALNHAGPAVPSRISKSVCTQLYMPGLNPLDIATNLNLLGALPNVALVTVPFINVGGAPETAAEPALRCYVYATNCGH